MKIAAVCGSLAQGSRTSVVLACVLRGAAQQNVETQVIDPDGTIKDQDIKERLLTLVSRSYS